LKFGALLERRISVRKSPFLIYVFVCATILTSCTPSTLSAERIIKPGDAVGGFTVEQGSPDLPYFYFQYYCDFIPDVKEPISHETDCEVPSVSGLVLKFGWLAKQSKFTSNWDEFEWELYIDDIQVALEEFDWYEFNYPVKLEDNTSRFWLIDLKNLTPGQHNLRLVQTIKNPIDDGFNVYQPGRYEFTANFTILERPVYKKFSSGADPGQHAYSSEKAGLDFLFYLPEEYDAQIKQAWPLLVFLHGAVFRGATLEMLLEDPLPRMVESERDFPFIVVSPIADGGYEFWMDAEITRSLLILLEEVQDNYSIDKNRVYLIGNDMGANGVWLLGLNYPDQFAALVPIGGYIGYPFEVPENICDLKDIPVWAFHGGKDINVPASVEQDLVDALNACGGNARISISQDMTINILFNVYTNPDLYDWLLDQSK
jgi:predicted esterase